MSRKKDRKKGSTTTPLRGHKLKGKTLYPPFAILSGKITFTSWMNDRLPEMLWAALIHTAFGREDAFKAYRYYLKFIGQHDRKDQFYDATLTGIFHLAPDLRSELLIYLCSQESIAEALQPLLLFRSLPGRDSWEAVLPDMDPDIEHLMQAVGATLWHQSTEATDCRWVKVMAGVLSGKHHIPPDMATRWFRYPDDGDNDVRPSIRASEGTENPLYPPDLTWPHNFWKECWSNTPCIELLTQQPVWPLIAATSREAIHKCRESLQSHWQSTHSTTAIDAKHDCLFGSAFYALRILEELLSIGISSSLLGRLGLRTLLEVYVNLKYLVKIDKEEVWMKWRKYGSGQAKLNALKLNESSGGPLFINLETLDQIANEDMWSEFISIELGHWTDKDIRKLSIECGLKETYDRYYSWTSAFVHGNWGSVRESSFATCGNPLHRLHRYPKDHQLPDVLSDAVLLVDQILDEVDSTYPPFSARTRTDAAS